MRLFLFLFASLSAFALKTHYVTFDHPDSWRCEINQQVYICQGIQEPDRRESIVLSIATIAGEWDSLDAYEKYLKTPRTIQDENGKEIESKISYTRRRNINGFVWIDSLQYNSELPGFWARYTATVQNKLAILITYIVSDDQYSKMAPKFEKMIASLKPVNDYESAISSIQPKSGLPGNTIMGPIDQKGILTSRLNTKKNTTSSKEVTPESATDNNPLLLVGLGAVIVAFLVFRISKKKQTVKAKAKKK